MDELSPNRAAWAPPARIRRQDGACHVTCASFGGEPPGHLADRRGATLTLLEADAPALTAS